MSSALIDESFSSSCSDESSSINDPEVDLVPNIFNRPHLTCNHRLATSSTKSPDPDVQNDDVPEEEEEEEDDLFPLINEQTGKTIKLLSSTANIEEERQEKILLFKSYFALTFLMVALLSLFFLFLNHFISGAGLASSGLDKNGTSTDPKIIMFDINLDDQDRYHLFWSVDYQTESILFELRLQMKTSLDWFAFGFSDYGSVANADLCLIWFDRRRVLHFQDAHTDNETYLMIADRYDHHFLPPSVQLSSSCQLVHAKRQPKPNTQRLLYVSFRRYFDTCNVKDYLIDNGTTHLVYATGNGPLSHVNGLELSKHLHGFQRVQLLKPPLSNTNNFDKESVETLDFLVSNVTVPAQETTYWCRLHRFPDTFKSHVHHIVQYESSISIGSKHLVHHMELFHCEVDASLTLPDWNGHCQDEQMPTILNHCKKVIAAWAYGAGPMIYPNNVGLPVGGHNYSQYLMIEVHYNNPQLVTGVLDNSGIRLHYTKKLRPYDAGILEIGLEYTDKNSIPPNVQMEIRGYCVSECTRIGLPPDGITIFASQLHTHLTGVRTWTEHIRVGVGQLPDLNRDNHYSPHFQEIRRLWYPIQVYPGDSLVHVCRYDTRSRQKVTLGGFGISDEMCVNYLHYYPKSNLEVCKSSIDTDHLLDYFERMHLLENQNTSKLYPISDNYHNIQWTPNRAKVLDELYQSAPLSIQCNQSNGQRFPGYWNGMPITNVPTYHSLIIDDRHDDRPTPVTSNKRCRWILKQFDPVGEDFVDEDYIVDNNGMQHELEQHSSPSIFKLTSIDNNGKQPEFENLIPMAHKDEQRTN